jgi:hypothetical protein
MLKLGALPGAKYLCKTVLSAKYPGLHTHLTPLCKAIPGPKPKTGKSSKIQQPILIQPGTDRLYEITD